jgi:hypothetical protein
MEYDWYKIFNETEFNALNLPSKEYIVNLEGIGEKTFLVTKGNVISVVVDDKLLPIEFNGENPWVDELKAVFVDINDDVYVGYQVVEE